MGKQIFFSKIISWQMPRQTTCLLINFFRVYIENGASDLIVYFSWISDELPERLTLPDVLATASSLQNLVSLSLLGKSKITSELKDSVNMFMSPGFWSYPMAKSDRSSLVLAEVTSQKENTENKDAAPLTRSDITIIIILMYLLSPLKRD